MGNRPLAVGTPFGARVILAILFALTLIGFGSISVSAQSTPVISINGDSVGPVHVVPGTPVDIMITDLSPNTQFNLRLYSGVDCQVFESVSQGTSNASGVGTGVGIFPVPVIVSYVAFDINSNLSNCINVIVSIPPPVVTFDGSEGPVNVVASNIDHVIAGTGFTPSTTATFALFNGSVCSDSFIISLTPVSSDVNGNVSTTIQLPDAGTFSILIVDGGVGSVVSNCIQINVAAAPPPVITFDGSAGPVNVVASNIDHVIAGTGFIPSTTVILKLSQGAACDNLLEISATPVTSDVNGNVSTTIQLPDEGTYAIIIDGGLQVFSNCIRIIVAEAPPPVITFDGSAGPVNFVPSMDTHVVAGSGFTPGADSRFKLFDGSTCSGTALFDISVAGDSSGNLEQPLQIGSAGTRSIHIIDTINGVSNCVVLIAAEATATSTADPDPTVTSTVVADPTATSTAEPDPTATSTAEADLTATSTAEADPTATATEDPDLNATATSTATVVADPTATSTADPDPTATSTESLPPTSTATEVVAPTPTEPPASTTVPTEPVGPTATSTTEPTGEPGAAIITVTTVDGSEIPDGTSVCLGTDCQNLDAIASLVAMAAPSGTQASFGGLLPGSYPLTVFIGSQQVYAVNIEIVARETVQVTIVLPAVDDPATPVSPNPTNAPPVISLPSTGVGESSAMPQFFLILMLSVAMIAIGTIGWRRRAR